MAYKLFDKDYNEIIYKDLQDKGPWYQYGESSERIFLEKYGQQLGLIRNPDKEKDKYTVDIYNINSRNVGDLKTQNTPLFQALEKYAINPQFAVTFNKKDYLRYSKFYPDIEIYFWIDWVAVRFKNKTIIDVKPMEGVWKIDFVNIKKLIETAPLHYYQQRRFDFSNNKESYVLDLNHPLFKKVI